MSESRAYSNSVTMAENPFQILLKTFNSFSRAVQTHLAFVFSPPQQTNHHHGLSSTGNSNPLLVVSSRRDGSSLVQAMAAFPDSNTSTSKGKAATGLTKEELGRATWTLLHTLAAQYPDHPTRQQKRDVKELMAILSRIYPCKECADHFKEVLRANPVQAGSQDEFSKWLCHAHNVVNRSLGKLAFPCQRVNARWGKLECKDRACDLQGTSEPRI